LDNVNRETSAHSRRGGQTKKREEVIFSERFSTENLWENGENKKDTGNPKIPNMTGEENFRPGKKPVAWPQASSGETKEGDKAP